MKIKRGAISYWIDVIRFVLLGRPPGSPADILHWALSVPYRFWLEPCRYDGRNFEEIYFASIDPQLRARLPLRTLYLLVLLFWPFVAGWRALKRGRGAWRYWRGALGVPELALLRSDATYSDKEWRWSRPDFSLSMLYAVEYLRSRPDYLMLDDKRVFREAATRAGFPLPRAFSKAEAQKRGGEYVVKNPRQDVGQGVQLVAAEALDSLESEALIFEERLRNHPKLLEALPADAPLSTLRVITILDPETGEPRIARCVTRIGRAGEIADNTGQGGIWANVDPETGGIQPGTTMKTLAKYHKGLPIRHGIHPDTKKSFVGLEVPFLAEGRQMALEAHRKLAPDAPSLGWDVALSSSGPLLLEVNFWTICYDYDPPTDLLEPSCGLVWERVRGVKEKESGKF